MSIQKALREYRDQHRKIEPRKLARRFLMETPEADLTVLIAEEIERLDRAVTRPLELAELERMSAAVSERAVSGAWSPALRERVYQLGDGTDALFGRMTAAQHRAKALLHRKLAAGNLRTAELHESAAVDIERAGVDCLDEMALAVAA